MSYGSCVDVHCTHTTLPPSFPPPTHLPTHTHTHTSISPVSTLTIQGRVYPVTDHYLPEIARTIHWREMGDEYTPDTNVDLVASVVVYLARSQPMVSPYRYRNIICRLLPWEQLPWKWFPWRLLIVAIGTTLQPFHWLNCYPHFLHCGGESPGGRFASCPARVHHSGYLQSYIAILFLCRVVSWCSCQAGMISWLC